LDKIFVDTAFWIALYSKKDNLHSEATDLYEISNLSKDTLFTTEEVLTEFANAFRHSRNSRNEIHGLIQKIIQNPLIKVVEQSHQSFLDGLQFFHSRLDKEYGLVDCISMNSMDKNGISEVLTCDKHFAQEGRFNVLMTVKN